MLPPIVDDRIELYAPDGSNPIFRLGRRLLSLPIPFSAQFVSLFSGVSFSAGFTIHYAAELEFAYQAAPENPYPQTRITAILKAKKGHIWYE